MRAPGAYDAQTGHLVAPSLTAIGDANPEMAAAMRARPMVESPLLTAQDLARELDVIERRRYRFVAEWLGSRENGQRTARWMQDRESGTWYEAKSWKQRGWRLSTRAAAYVDALVAAVGKQAAP